MIRLEMGRGWGSCTVLPVQSLWPGDADLLEPSWGWGRADPWGGDGWGLDAPLRWAGLILLRAGRGNPLLLSCPMLRTNLPCDWGSGVHWLCESSVGPGGMEVGSSWRPVNVPCLAWEPFQAGQAWPCHAGTVEICPGSSSSRSPQGSPVLLELLDTVLQLSTASPVANKCFEASYFICQPFLATDNCNAGVL